MRIGKKSGDGKVQWYIVVRGHEIRVSRSFIEFLGYDTRGM